MEEGGFYSTRLKSLTACGLSEDARNRMRARGFETIGDLYEYIRVEENRGTIPGNDMWEFIFALVRCGFKDSEMEDI